MAARAISILGLAVVAVGLPDCLSAASGPTPSQPPKATGVAEYSLEKHSASHPSRGAAASIGEAASPVGRCDVDVCEGNLSPTALVALRSAAEKARGCYEQELKERNQLEGRMLVRLRLAVGREPCEIRIEQNTLVGSEAFSKCVLDRIRETTARPDTGCIDLALPLNFVRQEIEAPKDNGSVP